jgi:hypothetical protein
MIDNGIVTRKFHRMEVVVAKWAIYPYYREGTEEYRENIGHVADIST